MKAIQFSVLTLSLVLFGCSRSAVYSPSILLGKAPLKEKEVDVQGSIELMPEARPEALGGKQTTAGWVGQLGYGFSDRFNMSMKGWWDIESRENALRSGYSLAAHFIKAKTATSRVIIAPKIAITLHVNDINGYGASTAAVYHKTKEDKIGWYGGIELGWGTHDFFKERSSSRNKDAVPMGFAALAHLGIAGELFGRFRVNAEITPVYQFNYFDENQQFIWSPTIGVGYTIRPKEKSHRVN